jgi:hypothetical protein
MCSLSTIIRTRAECEPIRSRLLRNRAFKVRMNTDPEMAPGVPARDEKFLNGNDFE